MRRSGPKTAEQMEEDFEIRAPLVGRDDNDKGGSMTTRCNILTIGMFFILILIVASLTLFYALYLRNVAYPPTCNLRMETTLLTSPPAVGAECGANTMGGWELTICCDNEDTNSCATSDIVTTKKLCLPIPEEIQTSYPVEWTVS